MRLSSKKNKGKIKRITLFVLATLLSLSSLLSMGEVAYALDPSPITMNNVKSDFDNSARAEHAAFKLYQCVAGEGGIHIGGSGWLTSYGGDGYNYSTTFGGEGGLFYYESANPLDGAAAIGLHSLSAGRWLETKVQGEFDDGMIDCGDNKDHIIDVFAALIGKTRKDIFCNGQAPELLQNADGGACGDSSSEYTINPDWQSHLAELYNNYISDKSGYPVTWEILSGNSFLYSEVDGYYLYSQDIEAGCGGSLGVTKTDSEEPTRAHSPTPLKRLDDYGNTTYEWFAGNGGNALSESGFVAKADGWTCQQYIERANDDEVYGKFRTIIQEKIKSGCYEARKEQIANAQAKFDEKKADMTEDAIAADQAILDTANALITSYDNGNKEALVEQYKDDEGNTGDGLMCKTIEGLDDVAMAAYDVSDDLASDESDVTCYTAGGSLGWILCPILEFTTDAVDTLYNSVIEPYLVMDATLFTSGSGDKTYEAWQTFQGIANICFVILFIFVIFSQLTGVGIDNYGIKKILPKLITAALLINLSYIICEVAIDISNIVGSGIKSIFDNLMTDVTINSITVENGTNVDGLNTTITGGVALLAVIVGAVALYTNGAAVLIPLFIAAISVLISIFFLFVLLSLRKAAVIILVVVSPLALGCYMLPNTKKFFDKWFKALQGMLLLYPIAGALVGGGNYVSKILLSTGNGTADFFFALSAMIIGIVPIFFIPGLLKSSFAAIGNIGAKLSGLTNKYGGKLTGGVRNKLENTGLTNRRNYQRMLKADARKASAGEYNNRRARRTVDRLKGTKISNMTARERNQLSAAQGIVDAENKNMQALYASRFGEANSVDEIGAELVGMGNKEDGEFDANMAVAAIERMGNIDQGKMLQQLEAFSETDAFKKMDSVQRGKIADTLSAQKGNPVAKAYAKALRSGSNMSLKEAINSGTVGGYINQMGASTLTDTDKDVYNYMQDATYTTTDDTGASKTHKLINSFNSEQIGHAISHLDGESKEGKQFQSVIGDRENLAADIDNMSVESFANSKSKNLLNRKTDGESTEKYVAVNKAIKTKVNQVAKNGNISDKLDSGYRGFIEPDTTHTDGGGAA